MSQTKSELPACRRFSWERSGDQIMDQKRLKQLLHYCSLTGVFTWKTDAGRIKKGSIAGATDAYGYQVIRLDKVLYKAHRLAWLYSYGTWPSKNIDHKNRVKNDNRLTNLRDVGQSANTFNSGVRKNNTSGVTGVNWLPDKSKWEARIRVNYRIVHLGKFNSKDDAVAARKNAEQKFFGCVC
jgi:hypothetical protein